MTRTGNTGIVVTNVEGVFHNNFFLVDYNKNIMNKDFIVSFLNFPKVKRKILDYAGTTTIPDLKHSDFYRIKIVVPPLPEQQKIAEILSTNDELISKTDEMIEKIKEIKKGLMQELLTKGIGHSEFKDSELGEIPKEWEVDNFSNKVIVNPAYKLEKGREYDYIEMAALSVESRYPLYNQKRKFGKNSGSKFKKGDTLFARITPCAENGKMCIVNKLNTDLGIGSTEFIVLSPSENIDKDYLYYYSKSFRVRNYALSRMIGTTGRKRIPNEVFKEELLILLPPLKEQKQIASILTSVDNKIEALEKRKEKLEEIKKGLMQDLLTGRVRVKID